MVKIRNLTKIYTSSRGIINLNLRIPRGETRAVIGPSGCGKTTLLHTMAGLLEPDSGSIQTGADSGWIGLVQQKDALFPWLTALENVLLGLPSGGKRHKDRKLNERGEARKASRAEALSLMEELGVSAFTDSYPDRMSGGERQRVSIARTLMRKPDLLLLDEPTASLDAFSKESLQNLLLRLHLHNPVTTLFVTHSIEEALFLGQEILVMGEGRIHAVHKNPFYPDRNARDHESYYSEVLKLRNSLKEVSAV
ncbi:MAG: ATP-binding cassette domain-containing protein [Spirochaetales bacterium]|nr:ATP-binding cassette domain-containing protein [Spirochaetales bacterium]